MVDDGRIIIVVHQRTSEPDREGQVLFPAILGGSLGRIQVQFAAHGSFFTALLGEEFKAVNQVTMTKKALPERRPSTSRFRECLDWRDSREIGIFVSVYYVDPGFLVLAGVEIVTAGPKVCRVIAFGPVLMIVGAGVVEPAPAFAKESVPEATHLGRVDSRHRRRSADRTRRFRILRGPRSSPGGPERLQSRSTHPDRRC